MTGRKSWTTERAGEWISFRMTGLAVLCMLAAASNGQLHAQSGCLPGDIEKYAAKAASRSDVNLDRNMLGFAGNFLSDKDTDQASAKKVVRGLNAIVVHSYEFEKAGEYNAGDLDSIRNQYKGSEWSHIVSTREQAKNKAPEYSDIWIHMSGGKSTGMVILSAEEKELSFVCIDGALEPSMLSSLSGQFGIPKVEVPGSTGNRKLMQGSEDEEEKQ